MANYGKWIGGALGWAVGGPIGGALGFFVGMMFDDNSLAQDEPRTAQSRGYDRYRHNTRSGDFAASLIVLSAAVMKADGRILKSELNFVRDFFDRNFGKQVADHHIKLLRDLLKQDLDIRAICDQIRYYMEHQNRILLLQYLFGIAAADGQMDESEIRVIRSIAGYLGISNKDFESIYAMFRGGGRPNGRAPKQSINDAYKILEIEKGVSDQEVKKAYRQMARKYHPDKNRNVGEEYQEMAKEKFIKVQEAYDQIKESRGMK